MTRSPLRYCVQGTLTANQPIHVGSGEDRDLADLADKNEKGHYAAVIRDVKKRPIIPASALKGVLHQLADEIGRPHLVRELFGSRKEEIGVVEMGGRLLFGNACFKEMPPVPPGFQTAEGGPIPLHWDAQRYTYIMPGTAIRRVTRTVQDAKLYHYEVVPAGAVFDWEIRGEGLEQKELGLLLELLDAANDQNRLILGAHSANGFGLLAWSLNRVTGLTSDAQVKAWLKGGHAGFQGMPNVADEAIKAARATVELAPNPKAVLTLHLELKFDGPFMIHDPTQAVKGGEDKASSLSHAYLKNEDGRVVLKAKSLHGALRSQAERIVRTVATHGDLRGKACYVESRDTDEACKPITKKVEVETLCLCCRLFGGNGWRSPVRLTDFVPPKGTPDKVATQEFVAIDRFTGGAAEGLKFKARYVYKPKLAGRLEVDLGRIDRAHAGLLALALRDLLEGDIPLGFGAAKGFGAAQGRITEVTGLDHAPSWWADVAMEAGLPENINELPAPLPLLKEEHRFALTGLVTAFHEEVAR